MKTKFTFVIVFCNGQELEIYYNANTQRQARLQLWNELTDAQQCNVESIECVNEEIVL